MDNKEFQKRIIETKTEIFPLDHFLPLESVYSIFTDEYERIADKGIFFRNRKFQRLREGYFALFAAISCKLISKRDQYLIFPSDKSNDLYIASHLAGTTKKQLPASSFDVKEFTDFSDSFENFIDGKILPKISVYNIIIGVHRKVNSANLQYLLEKLRGQSSERKIWLVGAANDGENNEAISRTTIVDREGILYDEVIDLDQHLDKTKPVLIYQDMIRFKYE